MIDLDRLICFWWSRTIDRSTPKIEIKIEIEKALINSISGCSTIYESIIQLLHCTKKPYHTACRKHWMLYVSQLVTKVWKVHSFNHFSSFEVWPQTKRVKTTKGYRSLETMRVACLMVARGTLIQKWINFSHLPTYPSLATPHFPTKLRNIYPLSWFFN